MYQQPSIKEDFMDQMRQQTKQVNEIEAMKMLEPGEVVVVCIDKIREFATRVGVSIDGKLYITNYRVRALSGWFIFLDIIHGDKGRKEASRWDDERI